MSYIDKEEWVQIRNFEDYMISNWGRVYSIKSDLILKPRPSGWGYLQVCLSKSNQRFMKCVHRLVAEHYIPGEDVGLEVNHIDGDKLYNNEINLEWVTKRMNNQHAINTGLNKKRGIKIKVIETGNIYNSIAECAKDIGMTPPGVKYSLRYKLKNRSGLSFEYVNRT